MSGGLHQATCVAIGGRGLLIEGAPGLGKSSLALALIERGATLVGDDGVMLEPRAGRLLAGPPPATLGKLELRGVGLLEYPTASGVPLSLIVRLDPEAERFRDEPEWVERAGVRLPCVALWPGSPVLALRAEAALRIYGLA
jgi:serine kinase of HPr protein (carbohydrate metabolism regulator)